MDGDKHIVLTNRMLDVLYKWVPLSASFRIALRDLMNLQQESPKAILLNPPDHAVKAWFSVNCYVAAYTFDADGGQHVVRIYMPDDAFTDLFSFFQDKPSRLRLVVIQGEELLYLKKEDFNSLRLFPETFDLVQYVMLMEQELEAWRVWIMTLKAEQKVQQFSLRYPMYLLPNHICASFLQMTAAKYCVEKALCNRNDRN
jgi:hypothetical protein